MHNKMDNLLAIRAFVRIAEAGSFAAAADQMNIPRSTMSKLIKDLESHLRAKLIQRTTRSVSVTPEGAAYYERAVRVLGDLEEMNLAVGGMKTQPRGRVRVDIGSLLANLILIPALPAFKQQYPDIEVFLGVSDRPVDLVSEGVDCVIRGGALADTSLVARRLCELDYVTCASRSYIDTYGQPDHPSDLEKHHRVLSYFSSLTAKPFPFQFHRGNETFELDARSFVAANESTAHMTCLLGGLGIGQTFRFAAQPFLDDGQLVPVLPEWTRPRHPLHIVYPPNRHLNAKLRVFLDWVIGVFAAVDVRA
jgi:LysR family transcriptional regulator, regulator for bpeEF and oprC